MIPDQEWGTAAAQRFFDGLTKQTTENGGNPTTQVQQSQVVGCAHCLRDSVYDIPDVIYYINGYSVCAAHLEAWLASIATASVV